MNLENLAMIMKLIASLAVIIAAIFFIMVAKERWRK